MHSEKLRVASGVSQLDNLLGGLYIGDNVIWYDNSGSLASVFCLNFIQASQAQNRPLIYVSFDRSPKNLLEKLGVLAVELSSFFKESIDMTSRMIFPSGEAVEIKLPNLPEGNVYAKLLIPVDFKPKAEPYLLEIPPKKTLPSHFFIHKGQEIGYLLSGKLQLKLEKSLYSVRSGDVIYLTSEMPSQWKNPGPGTAKLLWIKIK